MDKPEYRVCSFSGGKDSTAMLLRLLEEGVHIDCILFCDTGLEFPAMYEHIDKVERDIGRPITRIKNPESYEYLMFDHHVKRKKDTRFAKLYGLQHTGYGWAGPRMRWCTAKLKDIPREKFLRPLREKTGAYLTIEPMVGASVPVGVWEVSPDDELRLDRYEGFPTFYYKKELVLPIKGIKSGKERRRKAFVYIMHEERLLGIPSKAYLRTCSFGYSDFGFDHEKLAEAYRLSIGGIVE